VFDQIQTAHPAIRKTFNANFGGTLTNNGGIWSTTVGQSKLFMQQLVNNATPVVSPLTGGNNMTSTNYQETLSGNINDIFLHVFQAAEGSTAAMTVGQPMTSADGKVRGVEVAAGGKTWAVLFADHDRVFAGSIQYTLPSAGAHSHLIHDLLPLHAYVVTIASARTIHATTDLRGVLAFDTANGESSVSVTPG
jgi:hypothetical protein